MLATSSPSAGVYTAENNRGQRITAQGTSVGCIVGYSNRGPVMQRAFVTDNEDFRSLFGMKHPNLGYMHYCAESFLTQGNQLYVTRVVDGAMTGGAYITTENNFAVGREIDSGFEWDRIEPSFSSQDIMFVYAENQDFGITICALFSILTLLIRMSISSCSQYTKVIQLFRLKHTSVLHSVR